MTGDWASSRTPAPSSQSQSLKQKKGLQALEMHHEHVGSNLRPIHDEKPALDNPKTATRAKKPKTRLGYLLSSRFQSTAPRLNKGTNWFGQGLIGCHIPPGEMLYLKSQGVLPLRRFQVFTT